MRIVSGSAWTTGWTLSGNFEAEKKTPEPMNIGIMTTFINPPTVCVFCAREATRRPSPANVSAPRTERVRIEKGEPVSRTPNANQPKARRIRDLEENEERAHQDEREKKVAAAHRRRQHALDELPRPHIDDEVSDAPHAARHQVEPDEPGDEKIDVAGAALGYAFVDRAAHVLSPIGALQPIVDHRAREARFGTRVVVAIRARFARDDHEDDPSDAEIFVRGGGVFDRGFHLVRLERREEALGPRSRFDRDAHGLGRAVPEGGAERDGEDDREAERPEDGARLAEEHPEAREGQLHDRRARLPCR